MADNTVIDDPRILVEEATHRSPWYVPTHERYVRTFDAIIMGALVLLATIPPWFYGGHSQMVLEWLTVALASLFVFWAVKSALKGAFEFVWSPIHTVLAVFLLLGLIQWLPWPIAVRSIGSDPDLLGEDGVFWNRITMDPQATEESLWRLLLLFGYFLMLGTHLRTRRRLSVLMWAIVMSGCAISILALFNHGAPERAVLWRFDPESPAFGPFANRASFAAFVELVMPFALAPLIASPRRCDYWPILGVAVLMMSVAVVASASRAGVVLIVLEAGALMILSGGQRFRWFVVGLVFALGVAGVVWLTTEGAIDRLLQRFSQETLVVNPASATSRLAIWRTTLTMMADQPLLGVGLGAFRVAYPRYDTGNGLRFTTHAHNDFLHLMGETGVVGGLMCLLFLMVGLRVARRTLRQAEAGLRPPAIAAAVACGALALHSLVDVPLHVMAIALGFLSATAVLLAIQRISALPRASSSAPSPGGEGPSARAEKGRLRIGRWSRRSGGNGGRGRNEHDVLVRRSH